MTSVRRTRRLPGLSTPPSIVTVSPLIDSALIAPRADMADDAATAQMARDMREAAYGDGGMTRDGLELLGYSAVQIDTLAAMARIAADRLAAAT